MFHVPFTLNRCDRSLFYIMSGHTIFVLHKLLIAFREALSVPTTESLTAKHFYWCTLALTTALAHSTVVDHTPSPPIRNTGNCTPFFASWGLLGGNPGPGRGECSRTGIGDHQDGRRQSRNLSAGQHVCDCFPQDATHDAILPWPFGRTSVRLFRRLASCRLPTPSRRLAIYRFADSLPGPRNGPRLALVPHRPRSKTEIPAGTNPAFP
jgi:hypothetical protein